MSDAELPVTEHHLTVKRTARYCTLGDPAGRATEIWIVCHGFAQLAGTFIEEFRTISRPGRLIVAPEALNRFYLNRDGGRAGASARVGATWMTREDRLAEIDDYVRYLDDLHREITERQPREEIRVTALGFSQGTATVARWLAHGTAKIARVVLWAGLLPPEIDPAGPHRDRLLASELILVRGTADDMLDARQLEAQHEALENAGIHARLLQFDGGHRMDRDTLARVAADERFGVHAPRQQSVDASEF
jgi:predicted esterase